MWTLSEIHMNNRKLCNKCGKSPGDDMRSHHAVEALPEAEEAVHNTGKLASLCDYSDDEEEEEEAEEAEVEEDEQVYEDDKDSMVEEANENAETELGQRSKKKIKRAEDLHTEKFVCVKCGKGFQSQKAMCGHMACHSQKDKGLNNLPAHRSKNKSSPFDQKVLTDGHSDTETGASGPGPGPGPGPALRRRSKRVKHKNNEVDPAGSKPSFSVPDYTGGSSVSVVENEQEEVAKCLMMLSRDSGRWGGFNGDSSELSVEDMSRFKASGGQIGARLKPGHPAANTELVRNKSANDSCTNMKAPRTCFECSVCGKMFGTHPALVKHAGKHFRFNEGSARSAESDENTVETDMSLRKGKGERGKKCGSKRVKHECPVCLKGFRSGQALGGHKRIHLTGGASDELKPVNEQVHSPSQGQSCIDLNQPAPVESREFVSW